MRNSPTFAFTGAAGDPGGPLPAALLKDRRLWIAGANRDVGAIFRLAHQYAGISISRMARLCDMTPSRVSSYAKGRMRVRDQNVLERVADGLRLPGKVLGLAPRAWESQDVAAGRRTVEAAVVGEPAGRYVGTDGIGANRGRISDFRRPAG